MLFSWGFKYQYNKRLTVTRQTSQQACSRGRHRYMRAEELKFSDFLEVHGVEFEREENFHQWITHLSRNCPRHGWLFAMCWNHSPVFARESYWCSGTSPLIAFTPRTLIDFMSRLGFVFPPGQSRYGVWMGLIWFDGGLIHQSHHHLRVLISVALPGIPWYFNTLVFEVSFRYPPCPW